MRNTDSKIRSFGFNCCPLLAIRLVVDDFCNTICTKPEWAPRPAHPKLGLPGSLGRTVGTAVFGPKAVIRLRVSLCKNRLGYLIKTSRRAIISGARRQDRRTGV